MRAQAIIAGSASGYRWDKHLLGWAVISEGLMGIHFAVERLGPLILLVLATILATIPWARS